ncbi:hypothetical protein MPCS_01956 (plasmid) [Candidatus Megaera polyxenophila]|nr:hypothetical protein MPCS_01956 [Candidatus Megaera polyxenophila]
MKGCSKDKKDGKDCSKDGKDSDRMSALLVRTHRFAQEILYSQASLINKDSFVS